MSTSPSDPSRVADPEDRIRGVSHLLLSRPDLVERQCRSALASEPESAYALGMLAVSLNNQNRHQEALEAVNAAVHLAPDNFVGHNYRALVLMNLGRTPEANEAIQEAMRLAPEVAANFDILALIAQCESDWKKLASAAAEALRLDPDHERCASLYVLALRELGRGEEAVAAGRQALEHHPNSADIHAELAESLLTRGLVDEALEHFRQALQLDPNSERARSGVVTALKARYWIYRVSYKYFRIPGQFRQMSGLALVFLGKAANTIARNRPGAETVLAAFAVICILAVAISWLADPVFNLLLRLNRTGRWALDDRERRESNVVAACFAVGAASLLAWPLLHLVAVIFGIAVTVLAFPLTAYWRAASQPKEKWIAAGLSVTVVAAVLIGFVSFMLDSTATADPSTWRPLTTICAGTFVILTLPSALLTDAFAFRR